MTVILVGLVTEANSPIYITVGEKYVQSQILGDTAPHNLTFMVPPGETYEVKCDHYAINSWSEFRTVAD